MLETICRFIFGENFSHSDPRPVENTLLELNLMLKSYAEDIKKVSIGEKNDNQSGKLKQKRVVPPVRTARRRIRPSLSR